MNDKELNELFKQFRQWLITEREEEKSGESAEKQRNYAAEKQAERQPKYAEGWKNFSVVVPEEAAEYLKKTLEAYKKRLPQLFNIDSDGGNDESEK